MRRSEDAGSSGGPNCLRPTRTPLQRAHGFTLARQRDPESIRGFTLAELLIATGITVIVVVMLGWMLTSLLSTASHATERVDAFRDARAALQLIERDLRNLVRTQWSPDPFTNPTPLPCRASGVATTAVTLPAAYFALDHIWQPGPNDPPDPYSTGNPNGQLFALVADTTTGSSGDVCAVGYYCRWEADGNPINGWSNGRYTLRRFFRNSTSTFNIMQGAGTYAADSVLYSPSASDPVLAAYVWNFTITLYDVAGNPYTTYPCICDSSASSPRLLPAAIEISFNTISPQAARTVMSVSSSPTDWMDTTTQNYQRLILPHVYQFRSRINL
jgi:type II secretory pathway pseudopilin PulG